MLNEIVVRNGVLDHEAFPRIKREQTEKQVLRLGRC